MSVETKPFILTAWEHQHLPAAVLKILKAHVGRHNAITGKDLATALGHRDDRKIRLAIRELLREGYPIASSVSEPMGFYICSTEHEAMAYISTLRARAQEDLARLKDFEEAAAKKFSIPRQENLF
jgi:hypothetical protein